MGDLAIVDREFWRARRVFVTGHTGFKGGWLTSWLLEMGAAVTGFALAPATHPSYYALCGLERKVASYLGDIRDLEHLRRGLCAAEPSVVFHLAAQPLVRRSYREPVETFAINVMGTVNLLEAVRSTPSVRAVVVTTSDKCYENREWFWGYRESDRLGGHDPYSASKACAEIAVAAYRRSFCETESAVAKIASVRAGNVIGGGDWAEDRLIPDAIRALQHGQQLVLRNPSAVRPWQHVLEPVAGYLMLAQRLFVEGEKYSGAWNFGPPADDEATVSWVAQKVLASFGIGSIKLACQTDTLREAGTLKLDSSRARTLLGWQPRLTLEQAIAMTVEWYRAALARPGEDMTPLVRRQIDAYLRLQPRSLVPHIDSNIPEGQKQP